MAGTARVVAVTVVMLSAAVGIFAALRNSADVRQPEPAARAAADAVPGEIAAADFVAGDGERWYVADGRSHQVHVLDAAGTYRFSFGRKGRGPGEFVSPNMVAAAGARVYVAEPGRTAISVFDTAGVFVGQLRAPDHCNGGAVGMGVGADILYVLRRCVELPARIRYRLERSLDAKALTVWHVAADTVALAGGSSVPLHYPLFSVDAERLVFGDGNDACLRVVRLADGVEQDRRCLYELPRLAWARADREQTRARSRGRLAVPDSLPRVVHVALVDNRIGALTLTDVEGGSNWYLLPWSPEPMIRLEPVGRHSVDRSYLGNGKQLLVRELADGLHFEVIDVGR